MKHSKSLLGCGLTMANFVAASPEAAATATTVNPQRPEREEVEQFAVPEEASNLVSPIKPSPETVSDLNNGPRFSPVTRRGNTKPLAMQGPQDEPLTPFVEITNTDLSHPLTEQLLTAPSAAPDGLDNRLGQSQNEDEGPTLNKPELGTMELELINSNEIPLPNVEPNVDINSVTPEAGTPEAQSMPLQTPAETVPLEVEIVPSEEDSQVTGTAADLRVTPRVRASFNTPRNGDLERSFTRVQGFVPLVQTLGQDLTYMTGEIALDSQGNPSGHLTLGYRNIASQGNHILGFNANYDVRDTGNSTFHQLGAGAEFLTERWDIYANTYFSVGDSQQGIDTEAFFQNNNLLLPVETALSGLDLGVSTQVATFDNGGDLWANADLYHYWGSNISSTTGIRAGVTAYPTPYLNLGLGVQHDGLFGTNVVFQIGATLPTRASQPAIDPDDSLWPRIAELPHRQSGIVVDQRDEIVINPATGSPYIFRHVNPSAGTPNGNNATWETPRDTVANTVGIANFNDIVYVQAGNAGGSFTIPDGVQVRSVGPIQTISSQFGPLQLPGSGSGNLPVVTGPVTMGNQTVLSGFDINPGDNNGINAAGVGNFSIEDNRITNAQQGISLSSVTGSVDILRNQISATSDDGVVVEGLEGDTSLNIALTDNQLTDIGGAGISFGSIENQVNATVEISGNTIRQTGPTGEGLFFEGIAGNATAEITVANNTITRTGSDAVFFNYIEEDANADITIAGNVIQGTGETDDGIEFQDIRGNAIANISISDNVINDVTAQGIDFADIFDSTVTRVAITNNQIDNAESDGIIVGNIYNNAVTNITIANNSINEAEFGGVAIGEITDEADASIEISNNQISGTGTANEGIFLNSITGEAIANITIANNQITNVESDGIFVGDLTDDITATITVTGNVVEGGGITDDGIEFQDISGNANVILVLDNNQLRNLVAQGIDIAEILDNAIANISITNNQISTTADAGIFFIGIQDNSNANLNISNNQITEAGANGITIFAIQDNASTTLNLTDNSLNNPVNDGIFMDHSSASNLCLNLDNNTVSSPGDSGFQLISTGAGDFQIVNRPTVTTRNIGSFDPADLETSIDFTDGTAAVAPCP